MLTASESPAGAADANAQSYAYDRQRALWIVAPCEPGARTSCLTDRNLVLDAQCIFGIPTPGFPPSPFSRKQCAEPAEARCRSGEKGALGHSAAPCGEPAEPRLYWPPRTLKRAVQSKGLPKTLALVSTWDLPPRAISRHLLCGIMHNHEVCTGEYHP